MADPKELKKSNPTKLPDPRVYDECCAHLSAAVTKLGDLADASLQQRVSALHEEMAAAKQRLVEKIQKQ